MICLGKSKDKRSFPAKKGWRCLITKSQKQVSHDFFDPHLNLDFQLEPLEVNYELEQQVDAARLEAANTAPIHNDSFIVVAAAYFVKLL